MLFDKLAGFIERHHPELVEEIEKVALFEFPFRAHEVVQPGMFHQEDLDHFFLPFPQTAIEDKATCTFFFDTADKQTGLTETRLFIEIIAMGGGTDPDAFSGSVSDAVPEEWREQAKLEGLHQISFGQLFSMQLPEEGNLNYRIAASVDNVVVVNGRGEILASMDATEMKNIPEAKGSARAIIGNIATAVEELLLLNNSPETFIFESAPATPRKTKSGRITRSPDRPRFIPLKPNEIRATMGIKEEPGQKGSRRPHERRRHWRTLKSERYTHKRGQRVLVDACWIGPSEAVVGKRRYRVRLDI
jgi:hypothetical protein